LEGNTKGDLELPITGFNPMAKDHVIQKIEELEALGAETILENLINEFNAEITESSSKEITVVLNLADDLKGGWTNFYSSDFDSKFKLNGIINRNFCVPYFWTSEKYSAEIIRNRTMGYLNRTLYGLNNPKPKTLEEHLEQEVFAESNRQFKHILEFEETSFEQIATFYKTHKNSAEYDKIFNFFYGDKGSDSLGYKKFGIIEKTGFDYAKFISLERKTNA